MTLEKTCVFADTCKVAGQEEHCNFTCYPHAFMHGVENGSGGLWATTGVPNKYKAARLSNLPIEEANPKAYDIATKYVNSVLKFVIEKNAGLFLFSVPDENNPFGTGTGKTTTAVTILNHFIIERSRAYLRGEMELHENPAIFVKATELQNSFNAQFRGTREMQDNASIRYYKLKDAIKKTELVVLDDIATRNSRISEAFEDELYEILDYRSGQGKGATLFTSNVNMEELSKCLGDRIASRIAGMTVKVGFKGQDNRLDSLFK
ncbi:DNA replication protein [Priestia megaterium]